MVKNRNYSFLQFAKSLKLNDVVSLLESARNFNVELLAAQGLTITDVSEHDERLKKK